MDQKHKTNIEEVEGWQYSSVNIVLLSRRETLYPIEVAHKLSMIVHTYNSCT